MNKQGKQVVIVNSNVHQPQLANSNPASTAATKTPHQLSSGGNSSTANLHLTMKHGMITSYDNGTSN